MKSTLTTNDTAEIMNEVSILRNLTHSNIARLIDVYDEPHAHMIIMEIAAGGSLLDNICKKSKYTERDVRDIIKSVLLALEYIHKHNIVHGDVVPKNILMTAGYNPQVSLHTIHQILTLLSWFTII
jgi:calcium/calmodulin-dependent protein kinase I